jgi:glucose-fructose oxidoreductase
MVRRRNVQEEIRYAVVGLGHLAQVAVLPAFKNARNSTLAALVSGDSRKRSQLRSKYGIDRTYSYDQFEECLAQGIDAVYLVLPNHLHREFAVRAANAGVHVLCEKPMAVTEDECREMIRAADRNRVKLMVAYRLHFEKSTLQAIQLARKGVLGRLRIFASQFTQPVAEGNIRLAYAVSQGGGPVYDMGVYCINAARNLFGSEPIEISATSGNNGESRFRIAGEMTSAILRFPQERLASFTCSFGATDVSRYSLIGTRGVLQADPAYDYAIPLRQTLTVGKRTSIRRFPKRDQFAPELIYFSKCIQENIEPEPSGREGLADVRVVQALYESVRTGRTIRLEPLREKPGPTMRQQIDRPEQKKPRTIRAESPSGEAA